KKGDKVRKIHHLIFVPDIAAADRLVASLSRIGNLASDGRPILGLDSRDLLDITLETGPHSYLIPAHIWTPWFAALGSKSGFDSIEDCYGDLADHVFAVETGLSSDPPMNWRIASLDRYRLVSNSDAHSPPKVGREATTYDTDLDYFAMLDALKTGAGFVGTVEFFPEEGKYHMDGHRKCGVRFTPEQTKAHDGICPVCGQGLTVGVSHRIDSLADRTEAEARAAPPPKAAEILSLVPLPEILSEILGVGPNSKRVAQSYERLLSQLGPELAILETVPVEDIARAGEPLLGEAIARLRRGEVIRDAGYDGEYGVIRLFEDAELRAAKSGGLLFDLPEPAAPEAAPLPLAAAPPPAPTPVQPARRAAPQPDDGELFGLLGGLDPAQRQAAETLDGPVLIEAGPGSGKTRTLTHRIAHLVASHGAPADACLAITFTRRAAQEMRDRLATLLPSDWQEIPVHTFHSLGLALLRENLDAAGLAPGSRIADEADRLGILREALDISERKARGLLGAISRAKRTGRTDGAETAEALSVYAKALARRNWIDFDDLIIRCQRMLDAYPDLAERYRTRFRWLSVDEFQDVDARQYALLQLLEGPDGNLCVIGDANQAIYGFRGADAESMTRFRADYPSAAVIRLNRNYRSTGAIVEASTQVMSAAADTAAEAVREMAARLEIHSARSERAEAEFVVKTIEQLLGGHSFFSIDSGRTAHGKETELSFSDIAVLYRTAAQADPVVKALGRSGMPFQLQANRPLAAHAGVAAILRALDAQNPDPSDGASLSTRLQAATEAAQDEAADFAAAARHLLLLAESCDGDAALFAEAVTLGGEADLWDPRADRISLMTLHAAKGLEFPVVFIVGVEDGILPLRWGGADDASLEEERRLFYVGMTRAEDRLFLSRAEKRLWRGAVREMPPSPYLEDIEAALTEKSRMEAQARRPADRQLNLFS
ncbi:MAG: UvrD-helicase domain-containing protein, partial [Alphaproteobacteria bacterium]|nr:UvrD-helicase domain-containing protein [Alphaproteobacteria bacterium]